MKNAEWNKLTKRPLDDEEKEYYKDSKIEFMWDGYDPDIGEEVLVWIPQCKGVYTDIYNEYDDGMAFEYTDEEVIYWMSFPEPPKIKEKKR